jgi:hypothetical protein
MSDSDFSYADEGGDNANKENTPIAYPQIFVQDGARLKFFFSNSVTPGQQKVLAQQINASSLPSRRFLRVCSHQITFLINPEVCGKGCGNRQ